MTIGNNNYHTVRGSVGF